MYGWLYGVFIGNKVLGTFITEWDEGTEIANKLLSTKESAHMYAERLTELAVALGFDGWLVTLISNPHVSFWYIYIYLKSFWSNILNAKWHGKEK